jgi:predicted O-methyltransferase YrrM
MFVLQIAVLALLISLLVVVIYGFYKARTLLYEVLFQINQISELHLVNATQQMQTLQRLCANFGFDGGLPTTRGWAASPDFLFVIANHVRHYKPRIIVECSSGTSTLVLAKAAQLNGDGHVYSLEHDAKFAEITRSELEEYGLTEWATVLDSPLREHQIAGETWPWYAEENLPEGTIDMLIVDGPPLMTRPQARYPAGPILLPRLARGGVLFLDDADRLDERNAAERWEREFPEFEVTRIPTEKGCIRLLRR